MPGRIVRVGSRKDRSMRSDPLVRLLSGVQRLRAGASFAGVEGHRRSSDGRGPVERLIGLAGSG